MYIDAHTHVWFKEVLPQNFPSPGYTFKPFSLQDVIKEMDEANIDYIVIIAYSSRIVWNTKEDFAINTIKFLKDYKNRFSVVGGVEVEKLSKEEAKFWIEKQYEAGVSGFKIHPVHSWIKPNAYREEEGGIENLRILYEFAEDNNLPVIIHTGTSSFSMSRNKYGDPIFLDDIAVDFPKLKIVMAHMGRPNWISTAFQLCRIRNNIYAEISSIPPKKLLEYIPRLEILKDKLIYGSDVGGPGVKGLRENLYEFLSLNISDETKKLATSINPRIYKTLA
ncbi:amidohydrolase family protein [Acidianus manzaensis]|uniref:Amidohydrolase n=1 Tax=Acidianus manzaensis TaxID=282676 RepID=A0A1W6K2Y3_9CREN|nr:amidohydrolase family protein [Acidianus manzaensis]ARM76911.1 amidohydrolase [Acidianus manzaensis]